MTDLCLAQAFESQSVGLATLSTLNLIACSSDEKGTFIEDEFVSRSFGSATGWA